MSSGSLSSQSVPVYVADQIRATDGANMGDLLSFSSELILDDVYALDFGASLRVCRWWSAMMPLSGLLTTQASGFQVRWCILIVR